MIRRFSSRQQKLDQSFLTPRLRGALNYDRIAGYFSSSILEVAGEALETVSGTIRVVCNSELDARDVETAKAANFAQRREWCATEPEKFNAFSQPRFARLYEFLRGGKLQVRVLPLEKFGLVHGKAGVITLADGTKTSFIGSANETYHAWKLNYELVWEDDSPEAIEWAQSEFDALWNHALAVPLAEFIIEDVGRLARRVIIPGVDVWRDNPETAAPIVETPVYRREFGLMEHQKYFAKLAFDAHRGQRGARFVLADQVGLGKTLQLAMAGMLMALYGARPILVLAPKPLLWQWQDEMRDLLDLPSAVWNGKQWVDENEIEYPAFGAEGIRKCPRRIGIVSQGLITSKSPAADFLLGLNYECVIVDEAHRARRKNLGKDREDESPDRNNLLAFLHKLAPLTKSLLLATATPVQLHPVEAWDLLGVLAVNNEIILGNAWSNWRRAKQALDVVMSRMTLPEDDHELWGWVRNPLPPASEGRDFELIRRSLQMTDEQAVASGDKWESLGAPDRARIKRLAADFGVKHNPFIRHIIRRTREFLETTLDPETHEPYLKPVEVELSGEKPEETIKLPPYLLNAYELAEEFCQALSERLQASGFLKTLLLRRVGSTIEAGMITAEKLLHNWTMIEEAEDYEDDEESDDAEIREGEQTLTPRERGLLERFINMLNANQDRDPKYQAVRDYLLDRNWLAEGCIIFSQYFDSIWWLANQLSREIPKEPIGIYAGGNKSGVMLNGIFNKIEREELKRRVRLGEMRLILGTDAAGEGLNLQKLGTLINLDLPWNPTRLEQRKGRIQRIGQIRDTVNICNLRYKGSVEDRVHNLLAERLNSIHSMFGQIPDVLEDLWIDVAIGQKERAQKTIDAVPPQHPFEIRYHKIEKTPWESCARVLNEVEKRQHLMKGW